MKRSINLVNKQTILTYVSICALIYSVVIGGSILINGLGYTELSDLILLGIGISTLFPLIVILGSPKGVIKIDVVDGNLEVTFESHNFLFKRGTQSLIIENGSTYNLMAVRSTQSEDKYKLESDEKTIIWSTSSADILLAKTLGEYFANLGTETADGSYIFTNDITLEPKSQLRKRNIIRELIKAAVIFVILFGIAYQLLLRYSDYRYDQRYEAEKEEFNNQLQENME